ncbi:phosphoenolpyruvate synthase [Candidatus Uhrbacteria bacterium RIFCSPHIGHO2_12_FULL_46_13]|nr:MAG: phosphoenolpyruvate synthase [Candidatus Uhrbacteria bacterium RIFCSPHIGHO2_12_FULL_46_13]
MTSKLILWMEQVGIKDVPRVGGKNASLGEMIQRLGSKGVRVPHGFIVTADAYRYFLKETGLDSFIATTLKGLDTSNLKDLSRRGELIRHRIKQANFPKDLEDAVRLGYQQMEKKYGRNVDVAVRSSATAEDLPGASFAGEHDTYLGIRGADNVTKAVRAAMSSLFTDRAISYRVDKGFKRSAVALSVGVQRMVRSDLGVSGVIFTVDTESGFSDVVIITGSWGLGEMIVQGEVTPDEFLVWKSGISLKDKKPIIGKHLGDKSRKMVYATLGEAKTTKVVQCSAIEKNSFILTDKEILKLAHWAKIIEDHYSKKNGRWSPMDIEWAKDGKSGELFIVQARPETVQAERDFSKIKEHIRQEEGHLIAKGISVGSSIATGRAHIILDAKHIGEFKKGEILITGMTDPDWEPIMKIASAIITDKGGRTSHAAIVSRELGIPAVVGCGNATHEISTGDVVTVDTSGSDGLIFRGALKFKVVEHDIKKLPTPKTHIMMNIGTPEIAFEKSFLPNRGVGLAREEFIIASHIGVHPLALLNYRFLTPKIKKAIDKKTRGWSNRIQFYVDNLAFGIAKIGAAFYPHPVIVRFSDFKTNEYRSLLGGEKYEPLEENPMLGWRGASRYYDPKFKDAFILECRALKKVREEMGLTNVIPMVPFCRTPAEGLKVLEVMAETGLVTRAVKNRYRVGAGSITPVYMMCEIPSNVLLIDKFLDIFDGFSIGSNDLTQLTLGLDRDSGIVNHVANEKDQSVKMLIAAAIKRCRERKKYIGICGQGPSDYPDFAAFLIEAGIESMSLNPDTIVKTTLAVVKKEWELSRKKRQ